jgi:hypothetical protein
MDAVWKTVSAQLDNSKTGWSIGVFGALAEFHHCESPARRVDSWTLASSLGALRVTPNPSARLLAYEGPVRDPRRWDQGLVLCLPAATALINTNHTITELGPDNAAIENANREGILFDLGLGSSLCRFCVRLTDPTQILTLRSLQGRRITEPPVLDEVRTWDPHRVMISASGRVEVYQAIGTHETPIGPHTHLLPKILRPNVVTSAYVPVPAGYKATLMMYPESSTFQRLLTAFGDEHYVHAKARALSSLQAGLAAVPDDLRSRLERIAWRIAKRQLLASHPVQQPVPG